jgi:6,7-dimethyl-8-ribityllumazine synthase
MKGETAHFELILDMIAQGFVRVMHDSGVPIITEVLPVMNREQLIARSSDNEHNKGIEAAQACIDIIAWRRANP